jgi:hypothetical protein
VRSTDHEAPHYEVFSLSLLGPNILKHPRPTFLPQCQQLSFTPIQNNRQNCSSVCLKLQIFR